ncbi:MAG: hypothetical protein ACI9E4_000307 [Pseudohongiellaceae bacterium]|jgi:hypothetical protein
MLAPEKGATPLFLMIRAVFKHKVIWGDRASFLFSLGLFTFSKAETFLKASQ